MRPTNLIALLVFSTPTSAPSQIPVPQSPPDNAVDVSTTAEFSWSSITAAVQYELALRDSRTNAAFRDTFTTDPRATVVLPIAEWTYYWRVRAIFQSDTSDWSNEYFFTAGATGPLAPILLEPPDMTEGLSQPLTLDWREGPESLNHHVQVADNVRFIKPHVVNDTLKPGDPTEWLIENGLDANTRYYWRVRGINGIDWTWSRAHWFTTARESAVVDEVLAIPNRVPRLSYWPNPTHDAATVELAYDGLERIGVAVFDLMGRRVETLLPDGPVNGTRRFTWRPDMPAGLYLMTLTGDLPQSHPILIAH